MKARLLRWLVCPVCRGELQLYVQRREGRQLSKADLLCLEPIAAVEPDIDVTDEIVTGALTCDACRAFYPVHRSVPRLLPFPTEVARRFEREEAAWIERSLSGFRLQAIAPSPGELDVLRTFSDEWKGYGWTEDAYWDTTSENMLRCMQYVLGTDRHPLRGQLVLEVGIGIGGIANAVARAERCELIGMDLGYAVDDAAQLFGSNPLLHIVQGSLFFPPFRQGTFDFVYSQGVMHHTHSTKQAFDSVARLPRVNGRLYVWVYSKDAERESMLRRFLQAVESAIRPTVWRLPAPLQTLALLPLVPGYMAYQNFYRRQRFGPSVARYGYREAMHAARDRFTPRFAHRHDYEEVASWFRAAGYDYLELLRDERPPEGVSPSYAINVGISGRRRPASNSERRD